MQAGSQQAELVEVELPDGRHVRGRRRDGVGTPIVFLHGLLDSSQGWDDIAAASPRPSVAFDLPGFGDSDLPTRPRVSAYADDIVTAIRRLELRDVTLVGHSFGGAVAAGVAERIADRIASLLLLAPAGFGRIALAEAVSVPGVRSLAAAALPLWIRAPMALNAAYRLFVASGQSPPEGVVERVRQDAASLVPAAVMATQAVVAAGLSERGFHRRRLAYRGPVETLWGMIDRVVPPTHAQGVKAAFPQAELTFWRAMGHHPQRERSAQLNELVEAACMRANAAPAAESIRFERRQATWTARPATAAVAA